MVNFYCTIIDKNYVLRGLTLYNSFLPNIQNKIFGFFCVDDQAVEMLEALNLTNAWIVKPSEFESEALLSVKSERAMNEYCWTCKPAVLLYAALRDPSLDWLVYLDSDMMAFSDPDLGLPKDETVNACLTLHNPCTSYYADMIPTVGICNAGYAAFKNNPTGLRAAQWWLDRCLELCPRVPQGDAYADQKYFDYMSDHFEGVFYSDNLGLNAGPWNTMTLAPTGKNGQVFVQDKELLLYHFQGFKAYGASVYDLYTASIKLPNELKNHVFLPYVETMKNAYLQLKHYYDDGQVTFDKFPYSSRRILSEIKRYLSGKSNFMRH